jgi:WD40 repeat protein
MRGRLSLPLLVLCLALPLLVLWITFTDPAQRCRAGATDDYGDPLPEFAVARLGTTRWRSNLRYGSGFSTLVFAPDGKTIAASCDQGVTVFDAKTGRPVPWFAPDSNLKAAAFSSDGKTLITLGVPGDRGRLPDFNREKRLIQHWEVGTGKLVHKFEVERPRAVGSSFPIVSGDGRFCLDSGGGLRDVPKSVFVWDAATGKTIAQVAEKLDYGVPMSLSRDGKTLAVVREVKPLSESELCLYDLPAGKLRRLIKREGLYHYWPEFSPDGKLLVTASSKSLFVWDTATGRLLREISGVRGHVCFTTDGRRMACGADKAIRLYSLPDFKEVRRFEEHQCFVRSMSFSADGKWLVSGQDHVVSVWEVSTGKQVSFLPGHQAPVCSLAFSPDGRSLASGSRGDGTAYVWDLATRKPRYRLTGHYDAAASVAFAPDGRTLATGDGSPTYQTGGGERHIRLWDLADGHLVRQIPAHLNGVTSLDFAPDGKTLTSGGLDARVRLWDLASGKRLSQVRGDDGYHWARFAPDGKALLVAESRGPVALWRPDMKERLFDLCTLESTRAIPLAPAFTSHGAQVVVLDEVRGERGGQLRTRFWDVSSGKSVRTLKRDQGGRYGLNCILAPDGRTMATSSEKGGIELSDVETGRRVTLLASPKAYDVPMAFSPDGKLLASGSDDTTVLVWDVAGARRLHLFLEVVGDRGDAAAKARKLAADPAQAVAYLRQRLEAVAGAEKKLKPLLPDLDADDFATREKASRELDKIAAEVEGPLRQALSRDLPLEVQRRIEQALDGIKERADGPPRFDAYRFRLALTVLEEFDSAASRAALAALAEGAPDSEVGRAAKAALARQRKANSSNKDRPK